MGEYISIFETNSRESSGVFEGKKKVHCRSVVNLKLVVNRTRPLLTAPGDCKEKKNRLL